MKICIPFNQKQCISSVCDTIEKSIEDRTLEYSIDDTLFLLAQHFIYSDTNNLAKCFSILLLKLEYFKRKNIQIIDTNSNSSNINVNSLDQSFIHSKQIKKLLIKLKPEILDYTKEIMQILKHPNLIYVKMSELGISNHPVFQHVTMVIKTGNKQLLNTNDRMSLIINQLIELF